MNFVSDKYLRIYGEKSVSFESLKILLISLFAINPLVSNTWLFYVRSYFISEL